jgi:tRNA threonylcarbamoyl adenosine modification protein (Sua5/YciO/YrdC/YwlC family)
VSEAAAFERCLAVGGVAVFPADTVYGLACDPENRFAVERLYLLKRRSPSKPSAVMFFDLELALAALPELGERTRQAMRRLLPGPVSLLVPNPRRRFPLACGEDPDTLGLRVPDVPRLVHVRRPVLQSSANRAGGPDARRLEEVPPLIRQAADLVIDGGELPGTPSTVIDLRSYEADGDWRVVREGAVSAAALEPALVRQFHFEPASYLEMMRSEVPAFDRLQDAVAQASGTGARRMLELGTGTGETARRLLERHPEATLLGIDESVGMLETARRVLPPERVELRVSRLEDPLPDGPFDLVVSALCVHHLPGVEKAELFKRIAAELTAGGRFVLGDVVVPEDPADAKTPLTQGYDHPSRLDDQLRWLDEAGFEARVSWSEGDLAVVAADARGAGIVGDGGRRAPH